MQIQQESLYDYFESRYELDEIKYSAVYDFLTSLNFHAVRSKVNKPRLFCQGSLKLNEY